MADCSYSRCIQQKRYIRRELQRWTKNMVYIVGLERIAEELMGRRKWKLYQESMSRNYLQPINNNVEKLRKTEEYLEEQRSFSDAIQTHEEEQERKTESDLERRTEDEEDLERTKDWTPDSKCYICLNGKLDSENNTSHGTQSPRHSDTESSDSHSDSEVLPIHTPPMGLLNNNHNSGGMTTIESVTSMAALANAVAALSGNPPGIPTPAMPFYPAGLLPSNWYLGNVSRNFQPGDRMDVEKTGEQPLDLSSKSTNNSCSPVENKMSPNMRLPILDSKQIFKAKPRMSAIAGRRTYTEDELQAALRDIQSGKLGTRRAAVIYGIPRSTLRNKVYKLAMERERESHLNSSTLKIEEEEVIDDEKELSGAEEEKEVEKALQEPLLSVTDILRLSNAGNQDALKTLLDQNKEGPDIWAGLEHSAVGPYIQKLFFTSADSGVVHKVPDREMNPFALLPEIMKRMATDDQLHHLREQPRSQQNNGETDKLNRMIPINSDILRGEKSKSESSDMETDESPSNVILKIPSFKPTTNKNGSDFYRISTDTTTVISPPVTSDSGSPPILPGRGMTLKDVKDVIAKSISQKFQQAPEPLRLPSIMEMDFKRTAFTPPVVGMSPIKPQHELSRPYPPPHTRNPHTVPTTTTTTGGKGTRPKRGKYRNYDRDSLVEAVRAVQRGEMSVHRAGSYYGVPHSTLEYKVKERHLMRPRKRDPKPNPVDEKIASLKQNDLRVAASAVDKMKPMMKPPHQPKYPPTSPNGMKLSMFDPAMTPLGYNPPPPFPFWPHPSFPHIPLDYGRAPTTPTFPPNPEQFFASQMMQKLQEESTRIHPSVVTSSASLPKSTRQIAESLLDGTGANGSFLDGIIRSSLESGVPRNEDKSIKDEKNISPENMSNKALLEQLCRNSRLTPLPKPALSESSSPVEEGYKRLTSPLNFTTGGVLKEESISPSGLHFGVETSPKRFDRKYAEVPTIELSNDSTEGGGGERNGNDEEQQRKSTPPTRIYLKQDLVKPENLKPEMLVRFRDVLQDVDRNGIGESATGSASESDVAQD